MLVHITTVNKIVTSSRGLSREEYNRSTSRESIKFMESLGGTELSRKYGIESRSPDGETVSYIGEFSLMPKYIQRQFTDEEVSNLQSEE